MPGRTAEESLHVRARHAAGAEHADTRASVRARCFAPIAESAPTRMCWMTPSLRMASGAPFSVLNRKMRPQNFPGSTQYFSREA